MAVGLLTHLTGAAAAAVWLLAAEAGASTQVEDLPSTCFLSASPAQPHRPAAQCMLPPGACCRTPEEHAQGAVPGSINIPVKLDDGKGGFVDNPQFLEQARARGPVHEVEHDKGALCCNRHVPCGRVCRS